MIPARAELERKARMQCPGELAGGETGDAVYSPSANHWTMPTNRYLITLEVARLLIYS